MSEHGDEAPTPEVKAQDAGAADAAAKKAEEDAKKSQEAKQTEPRPRRIFISASSLANTWHIEAKKGETALQALVQCCEESLFFFGSKRSWLFPATEAELAESRQQGSYEPPTFPKELSKIILEKESRSPSEVYFLKPPTLQYRGFGTGCHPEDPTAPAFTGASRWLESHGLNPLILDAAFWVGGAYGSKNKSLTGVPGASVVKNYLIGEHDYNPCIELLYQSNPGRVEPLLVYKPANKPANPREAYKEPLAQLQAMGFLSEEANIQALTQCQGSVDLAIEKLVNS